jgi:mono/diheme cytochrome c family protein
MTNKQVAATKAVPAPAVAGVPFLIQPQHLDMGEVTEGQEAHARLFVRNTGLFTLHIAGIESACGCTVGSLGSREVPPGGFTTLDVSIDTTAKGDAITKKVTVVDGLGRRADAWLTLRVRENPHAGRMDGRGIFSGKCAACHAVPAAGKTVGAEIYAAVCVMCHGEAGRGAYAPRLRGLDADTLRTVLEQGINRRMPAFAKRKGGPLNPRQIVELSKWLSGLDE